MIFNWRFWRINCPWNTSSLACMSWFLPFLTFSWKFTYSSRFCKRNPDKAFNFHWSPNAELASSTSGKLELKEVRGETMNPIIFKPHYINSWKVKKTWRIYTKIWHLSGGFIEVFIEVTNCCLKIILYVTKDSQSLD